MTDIKLARLNNVPLLETGLEYQTLTGPFTFTSADLESAVNAFESDPSLRSPVIKLGHNGQFADTVADAEPSFGRIENLHVGNNNQTLYGDLVGFPAWMQEVLPYAYPQRSVEGAFGITTHAGNKHQFVVTAVALLGVYDQAISTLDDLESVWSGEGIDWETIACGGLPVPVKASVEPDQIRRAFYQGPGGMNSGWWIRSIQLEPDALIVDCDDGTLASVPFTIDANDAISFGDGTPVKVQYVPIAAGLGQGGGSTITTLGLQPKVLAAYTSKDDSKLVSASSPEGTSMNLREKLGLPAEATDEEVEAALDGKLAAPAQTLPPPTAEVKPAETAPVVEQPGTVLVDAGAWALAQQQIALGVAASEQLRIQRRDEFVGSAVKAGKIPPASAAHFTKLMDLDPDGTKTHLDSLAAGVVPVVEAGHSGDGGVSSIDAIEAATSYPLDWLPASERASIQEYYAKNQVTQ